MAEEAWFNETTRPLLEIMTESSPLVGDDPLDHVHADGRWGRTVTTLEAALTGSFSGGFCWGVLGRAADTSPATLAFAVLTGLGSGLGVGVATLVYYACKRQRVDIEVPALLAFASFWTGLVWQPTLNLAARYMDFGWAAVVVGFVGGCVFLLCLRLGRVHVVHPDRFTLARDVTLGLAIVGQEAVFACSQGPSFDRRSHIGYDILGFVSTTRGMSVGLVGLKSGAAAAIGFLIVQTCLNVVLPAGSSWNDVY
mmetsp:Transcript_3974/g.10209  ORF Transcript_3974/g.10209 Transcript_3974/m.10209 type:complete len:253 (-) Transcript_3974:78-836(-)|eukprot:CAMPEP_0197421910 /NCGR_PEP_ID=MMETSP1170-20131217/11973_1 /TAXON_ID=54406 /ORGANISM="Sarcinochrysis sp, Strain CCMP770" /LENGTH=252 /DNA_ID=CAMNT_0042949201 /DNA_START=71 /DNA_END=829 /DNA_ORIENTATION=+